MAAACYCFTEPTFSCRTLLKQRACVCALASIRLRSPSTCWEQSITRSSPLASRALAVEERRLSPSGQTLCSMSLARPTHPRWALCSSCFARVSCVRRHSKRPLRPRLQRASLKRRRRRGAPQLERRPPRASHRRRMTPSRCLSTARSSRRATCARRAVPSSSCAPRSARERLCTSGRSATLVSWVRRS